MYLTSTTTIFIIAASRLLGLTTAQAYEPLVSCSNTCTSKDTSVLAALEGRRPPNATRSLTFSNEEIESMTWRVNVTSFPHRSSVMISHDFSWPDDYPNKKYCLITGSTWGSPPSLINKYESLPQQTKDQGGDSCTPVLGEGCVKALEKAALAGDENNCFPAMYFSAFDCHEWMGLSLKGGGGGGFGMQAMRLDLEKIQSGKPFLAVTDDKFYYGEKRKQKEFGEIYREAVDMVQVVILRSIEEKGRVKIGCMRLGKESESNVTVIGDDGGEEKGEEASGNNGEVATDGDTSDDKSSGFRTGESLWGLMFGLLTASIVFL
ncbi:hypothetical protein QBC38DRAFT_514916 [Podospora fimiseda]|uniref:Uncharacterized protein n=1 Tax=Podospora fimiseda TaxID=252190 RepID=A0AAN7BJI7_9PEZI|nr:hypothetical protein QBC38DRAFT_514916 [Podospora fimiseda]